MTFNSFPKLEKLISDLRNSKAKGTKASVFKAFGVHINPEIISNNTSDILDVLRSFILLYPYLITAMKIDISRRITKFIDPFNKKYCHLVTNIDYKPSLNCFIKDYLTDILIFNYFQKSKFVVILIVILLPQLSTVDYMINMN